MFMKLAMGIAGSGKKLVQRGNSTELKI